MFLSQNPAFTKKIVFLSSIILASGVWTLQAQNRYGANPDLGVRINTVEGNLNHTASRVGKLEGDVATIKKNLGYTKTEARSTPTTGSTAKGRGNRHRVAAGETLSSISRRYKVGVDRLIAENHITNPNTLHPGQEIFIPGHKGTPAAPKAIPVPENTTKGSARTHTVRVGDTLSNIARKFGVTSTSIAIANRLLDPNAIRIGQKLQIPTGSSSPAIAKQQPINPTPRPKSASPPKPQSTEGGEMIAPEGYGFYEIEPGDTLHSIAISFGTNPNELRLLNDFPPANNSLRIGDFLLVPVPDESLFES